MRENLRGAFKTTCLLLLGFLLAMALSNRIVACGFSFQTGPLVATEESAGSRIFFNLP